MDKDEFAQQYTEQDEQTVEILTNFVYDDMAQFCRANGIPEDEITDDDLEEMAETFVEGGVDALTDDE
jgi:hypothetical protein